MRLPATKREENGMHELTAENGLDILDISNEAASAKIALQGAHLFEYTRRNENPLLWISPTARFEKNRAIRGGIPVCWPWFGKDTRYPDGPQHGFARTALWTLTDIGEPDASTTVATLSLDHTDVEQSWFPYRFRVTLRIVIGKTLEISLQTENLDERPFTLTEALHTYFAVGDIASVQILGLQNTVYADALDAFAHKSSAGAITITQETDRVYLDTNHTVIIRDDALRRSVTVGKSGSRSTVVWNPWIDKAKRMEDFADDSYKTMVCIETANALRNGVTVAPGTSHTLIQHLH